MKNTGKNFPEFLQAFFTERLARQQQASQHTLGSYRDTFRLLLEFAQLHLKKPPSSLLLEDLNAPLISSFLDYLEKNRKIGPRSRNQRLAAIRSFYRYISFEAPELSATINRVLAIPSKKYNRAIIEFLSKAEIEFLLAAPNRKLWIGRRDHCLMLLAIQTGLRVSELINLRRQDIVLGSGAHVRCMGKGRKERCTPLTKQTGKILKCWIQENRATPSDPLFPTSTGKQMSSDTVQHFLGNYSRVAAIKCPSLNSKRISPHVLRHTTAIQLLQSGVDCSVIALWLGHESVETTQIYLDANLTMKEEILKKTAPIRTRGGRYKTDDKLLAFLKGL